MERVVRGPSFVYGSSVGSRRRGRLSYFQGSVLWFLIVSLQISWVVAERNTQIQVNGTTVWNQTLQKDILHCSNFHEANTSSFFFYWPEDNFQYCCLGISPQQNLISDYRYSMYGNPIIPATYYDLGLIDECLPYWYKGRCLYHRYMAQPVYYTFCEWQDMIDLYKDRFWRLVFGKYGLAMTALPLILSLQLCVFLVIALQVVYWRYWHSKDITKTKMPFWKLGKITRKWFIRSWKNVWMDWLHLCLLSIISNGLVEAVGRTNPYGWQAKMFYRYTMVYLALSVILWASSFLHQVTHWIAVYKKETKKPKNKSSVSLGAGDGAPEAGTSKDPDPAGETRVQIGKNGSNTSGTTTSNERKLDPAIAAQLKKLLKLDKNYKDPEAKLRKLLQVGPDLKWQPIAAETAILFCLWAYLTYPNEGEGLSSTLLSFLVQAASPWSGLYACRVLFLTLPFLLKEVFNVKHVGHLPRHLLNKSRCKKAQCGSKCSKSEEQNPVAKQLPKWLQWGRVLCCLGCCACWNGGEAGHLMAREALSSSSSSSDSDL